MDIAALNQSLAADAALRHRLRFGGAGRDAAGRGLLAALGLRALAEQDARGYALRSRCDLVCDGRAPLERVHADGSVSPVTIDRAAGFALPDQPLRLMPQDKLIAIVRKSQELALHGAGGEDDGDADA